MILAFIIGCSSINDKVQDTEQQNPNSPYIATGDASVERNQEARWLVEYANATDVQFLFSVEDESELQFSIFSSEGELLWSVNAQSPCNESYWIEPDCEGFCSFIAKSYVQVAEDLVSIDVHILASTYDDVVITSLP